MTPDEILDLIVDTLHKSGEQPGTYRTDAQNIVDALKEHNLYIVGGGAIRPKPEAPSWKQQERENVKRLKQVDP